MDRFKKIVMTSIIGIIVNISLGIVKTIIGLSINSLAVITDAFNNFSDSISSVVSIITLSISSKGATKKHPFGFGRIEYISGAIISVIVIVTGFEFFSTSFTRIINPVETDYSTLSVTILLITVIVKIILGTYTKKIGEKENAPTLIASGKDAIDDSVITSVTIIGAILSIYFKLAIDGYIGIIVSIFLLKSGFEMFWRIISELLGERGDIDLAKAILKVLKQEKHILGAYDLALHNYGPNFYTGDVNVELPDTMSIKEAYVMLKPLRHRIFEEYGVILYVGFYSVNTTDAKVMTIEKHVKEIVLTHPMVLQVHAFILYEEKNIISFDVVADFECKDLNTLKQEVIKIVDYEYNSYKVKVTMERDFSYSD